MGDPQALELLHRIRIAARTVSDHMKRSAGGDEYAFRGSTNMIDDLQAALDEYDLQYEDGDDE